jgi:hypothetical protein
VCYVSPVDTWGVPVGACVGSKEGALRMSDVAVGLPKAYPLLSRSSDRNMPLSIEL